MSLMDEEVQLKRPRSSDDPLSFSGPPSKLGRRTSPFLPPMGGPDQKQTRCTRWLSFFPQSVSMTRITGSGRGFFVKNHRLKPPMESERMLVPVMGRRRIFRLTGR